MAGKIQQLQDSSALSPHIRPQWIVQALAATGKASVRGRKLPAEQVAWLVIALPMYRHQSIAQVVAELDLARDDELHPDIGNRAVCQRQRLGEEVAFFLAVKVILTKRDVTAQKNTDAQRDAVIRQIIIHKVASERVVDIFDAVRLDKPNSGLLDDGFLAQVKNLPERNLAVKLLKRLLEGQIKTKFATNVVQQRKFSDLLTIVIARYQNRSIETTPHPAKI